jgi:hypothetical protein
MAIEIIDVGMEANDGTGDPLRTAFQKINNNFIFLQQTSSNIAEAVTLDDTPDQVIFAYDANIFTQALFQIKSYNPDTNDSQDIRLQAQLSNDGNSVKFTGYGTSFIGDSVCTYDMAVISGSVCVTITPLANVVLNHFISYQITWVGDLGLGSVLATQNGEGDLITESNTANVFILTEN